MTGDSAIEARAAFSHKCLVISDEWGGRSADAATEEMAVQLLVREAAHVGAQLGAQGASPLGLRSL